MTSTNTKWGIKIRYWNGDIKYTKFTSFRGVAERWGLKLDENPLVEKVLLVTENEVKK